MSLPDPRAFFGIHSFAPYNRSTGVFYGILKVLGSSSLSLAGETVDLLGGSSKYPFAVEDAAITAEMNLRFSQYEDFLFELFLGNAVTTNAAESAGDVSTIANKNGTTAVNATTGIASIAAKSSSETDLKFGKYLLKVVSGGTDVDVYLSTDLDLARGTDGEYSSKLLKVAAGVTIPNTGATVDITGHGITITGGSGTVAMTVDDTAEFEVRPINTESTEVVIGATTDVFPEWGAFLYGQKRGNGEMVEIDCYRCKAIGMPLGFEQNTWSEAEVTAKVFYDSARNGVFKLRHVKPSTVN